MTDCGLSIVKRTQGQWDEDRSLSKEGIEFLVADSTEPTRRRDCFGRVEYC